MQDAYLQLEKIGGESTAAGFEGQIQVLSFGHSLSMPVERGTSAVGAASVGRCQHSDFSIMKLLDKSSPLLAQACSKGDVFNNVTLTLRHTGGGQPVSYMVYRLSKVYITAVDTHGSAGESRPSETVRFNYGKIEWTYTPQEKGKAGGSGNTTGSWNLESNATA
jgi:type VI secretion system secreted protein Hcp